MKENNFCDVTELKIYPVKTAKRIANFIVTINNAIIINGHIMESEKGIKCYFPNSIGFIKNDERDVYKELSNRILATYVINYCCDDYNPNN